MTDQLSRAQTLLDGGQTEDAYRALIGLFHTPNPLSETTVATKALDLLATLSARFGAADVAQQARACAADPNNVQALYDTGYALYEARQFAAGAAVLYRANQLAPGQPAIVTELSSCLEPELRYAEAAFVVEQSGLATREPFCMYLSGFAALMCGDLERARASKETLRPHARGDQLSFMYASLDGMLTRAAALESMGLELNDLALTAWQAVISGSLLLHESPHGYPEPMGGRYAFVQDSAPLERAALEHLGQVLETIRVRPPRVIAAPDRASHILALATAKHLNIPCEAWTNGDTREGLVVAWTMEAIESTDFLQTMHVHRPRQHLFVHASSWTAPFAYAPDFTTLLYQHITHPWTGGALQVDEQSKQTTRAAPDPRPDHALAEIVTAQAPEASAVSVDVVLQVARALATVPAALSGGAFRQQGKRLHQRAGGPVASNRFV